MDRLIMSGAGGRQYREDVKAKVEHHPLFATLLITSVVLLIGSIGATWLIFVSDEFAPVRADLSIMSGFTLWVTTVGPYVVIANLLAISAFMLDTRVRLGSLVVPLIPDGEDARKPHEPVPHKNRTTNSSARSSLRWGLGAMFFSPLLGFFAIRDGWYALGAINATEGTQKGKVHAWIGLLAGVLSVLPLVFGAGFMMWLFFTS